MNKEVQNVLKGFDEFIKTLEKMSVNAAKVQMPLVADALMLAKNIAAVYKKAFEVSLQVEENSGDV